MSYQDMFCFDKNVRRYEIWSMKCNKTWNLKSDRVTWRFYDGLYKLDSCYMDYHSCADADEEFKIGSTKSWSSNPSNGI